MGIGGNGADFHHCVTLYIIVNITRAVFVDIVVTVVALFFVFNDLH